ncbi:MAG: Ig-like domain-containing protein, partial [Anaerovoracaceae bacterium]
FTVVGLAKLTGQLEITVKEAIDALAIYAISYDANLGGGGMAADSTIQGEQYTPKTSSFIRTGYTWDSWNTAPNGTGTPRPSAYIPEGSETLYAQWNINSYDVSFEENGGTRTGGGALSQTINHGSAATAPTMIRTGYTGPTWDKALTNITGAQTITANWTAVKVLSIKLNKSSAAVARGKPISLIATVAPINALNKAVTWKSSNIKYATVTAAGKVTIKKNAIKGKTVSITCTAKDGSGKKATCKIKIK